MHLYLKYIIWIMPTMLFRNVTLWNEISTHLQEWADTVFISLVKIQSYISNTQVLSPFLPVCVVCLCQPCSEPVLPGVTRQSLLNWSCE